jgi:cytochrome c-type biogenesis protein CcmH
MMFAFVLLAGSLAAGAAVLLLLPLMRRREDSRPAAAITAGVVLFGLLLGGGALYAAFSNYSWVEAPAVVDTPAAAAATLAKQLAKNPDNIEGWMDLGRRYFELQQYPLAMRAFQRADRLAGGKNTEAISSVAEILLAQDFENIRGAAGRMFERVLELEPQNPKALMYSALAAMGRGENALARDRFERMLALNPRADIRHIVEKQISAIDAAEAGQSGASPALVAGGAPAQAQTQTQAQTQVPAQVQVHVTVSPSLRYQLTDQSALFVAARDPDQPGPPSGCHCVFRWMSR